MAHSAWTIRTFSKCQLALFGFTSAARFHAFTIHVTALILLKGFLYARSSRLIPDKANLGVGFPCDGPGRGGNCQVSAWDHVFLGLFWIYDALSIVIFHFSWKMQADVWGTVNSNEFLTSQEVPLLRVPILIMVGCKTSCGHNRLRLFSLMEQRYLRTD